MDLKKHYPIDVRPPTMSEKIALSLRRTLGYCPVCNKVSSFSQWNENFRESGICSKCSSTNRQRQIARAVYLLVADPMRKTDENFNDLTLFNTEAIGCINDKFKSLGNYVCSEYLGPDYAPGEVVDGVRNEDAQNLSFADNSIDLILSSDVWEHIPDPYQAHSEVHRVLKKGGKHIFSVPFHQLDFLDETRARLNKTGELDYLTSPIFHQDPLRPEGVLVFTIFSIEMCCKLSKLGLHTNLYSLYNPLLGILGVNGLIFESIKI